MSFMVTQQIFKCEKTGQTSHNFIDVLPEELELNRGYYQSYGGNITQTKDIIFKGINLVPAVQAITPEMQQAFNDKPNSLHISEKDLLTRMRKRLKEAIVDSWRPSASNIIIHSSGRDSRMLSWIIRGIARERGSKWLGRIVFICNKWEGPPFKEIMQYEGWKPNQYLVVGEGKPDDQIFAPVFQDFTNAWKLSNGTYQEPRNMFMFFPLVAHRQRKLPLDDVQLLTGLWSDELAVANKKGGGPQALKKQFEAIYLLPRYTARPRWGEVIKPYADINYCRIMATTTIHLGANDLRNKLLVSMDSKLWKFHNWNVPGHKKIIISASTLHEARKKYFKSWYAKTVKSNIRKVLPEAVAPFNFYFSIASLCQYLLTQGHKIK